MFALALLLGIYSYSIFIFGILNFLNKPTIIFFTIIFIFLSLKYYKFNISSLSLVLKNKISEIDKFSKIIISLITLQAIINLIGVFGPELGFDALWYHLTLPKIFLEQQKILHIPGGLLYYSDLPKLGETLYISALSFGSEIYAKLIHFVFGFLCLFVIFRIAKKFVNKKLAILASLIFYSNLIVGWESITAYIDLIRAFFEVTAFLAFIEWIEKKDEKLLYESAIILGLAISTKLIAIGSIAIFVGLIVYHLKDNIHKALITSLKFASISMLVVSPWFLFSYFNTGNPVYPLFTKLYYVGISQSLFDPINFFISVFNLFLNSPDPISPIYFMVFPLIFIYRKKLSTTVKYLFLYSGLSIVIWYLTPQTGGGRFFLPYLPVLSVLTVYLIGVKVDLQKFFIGIVLIVAISSIGYRLIANYKFVPVILNTESKEKFMSKNLNFSYGDFYDTDGFFKRLKSSDRVLLYGFHNLYYVNFPFIDSSYIKYGDRFNFIATQNTKLPDRFKFMNLVYSNSTTGVSVYSLGGIMWDY